MPKQLGGFVGAIPDTLVHMDTLPTLRHIPGAALLTEPVAVEVAVLVECGRDGWDQPISVGPTGKILRREITVPTTESAK